MVLVIAIMGIVILVLAWINDRVKKYYYDQDSDWYSQKDDIDDN
jgi:hypothetical protein